MTRHTGDDYLIDKAFLELRKIVRAQGRYVMRKLFDDYVTGPITKPLVPSCIICGTEENITKEHVVPRWVFENDPTYSFTIGINGQNKDFISATLPACARCNSELLNNIERYIQKTLSEVGINTRSYSQKELANIIRWLEIIEYKYQIWTIASKFVRLKGAEYLPSLADFSIAFIKEMSVRTITSKMRLALARISTKDKIGRTKSLAIGVTIKPTFYFAVSSGDFLHLEIPSYKKVFFYFFTKEYKRHGYAWKRAFKIIHTHYKLADDE